MSSRADQRFDDLLVAALAYSDGNGIQHAISVENVSLAGTERLDACCCGFVTIL